MFTEIEVEVGTTYTHYCPTFSDDDEGDFVVIFSNLKNEEPLPSFITNAMRKFVIEPTLDEEIGTYEIEVTIVDNDSIGSGEALSASGTFLVTIIPAAVSDAGAVTTPEFLF